MPNWCSNELSVSGEEHEVQKFRLKVESKESCLDFEKISPIPKVFKNISTGGCTIGGKQVHIWKTVNGKNIAIPKRTLEAWKKKYGSCDWYDWCVNNWGTKWNANDAQCNDDGDCVWYRFETAWAPPIQWLEKASKKFPKLNFKLKYEEEGMGFMGCAKAEGGMVEDKCID